MTSHGRASLATVMDIQFLGPVIRVRLRLHGEGGALLFDAFNRPGTVPPVVGSAGDGRAFQRIRDAWSRRRCGA